jgi:hypothetical protein
MYAIASYFRHCCREKSLVTNKSRIGDMLLTELVSEENGDLTLWWIEAHSPSMK